MVWPKFSQNSFWNIAFCGKYFMCFQEVAVLTYLHLFSAWHWSSVRYFLRYMSYSVRILIFTFNTFILTLLIVFSILFDRMWWCLLVLNAKRKKTRENNWPALKGRQIEKRNDCKYQETVLKTSICYCLHTLFRPQAWWKY